ncbi:hypothetical protein EXIGLDRAFT_743476 [Exidia glandulosa HHB12029]|uniref:Uncharacterized protein n=1 Tax=Exidia glandulosa HHB12029 TaxID=1314781 RepID=A0A165QJY8_EXIGL|nr:hypothetical protein EXIGLDRAFT_743476 [Exidia glandulosa HHB12029]
MASDGPQHQDQLEYSCNCLNVTITPNGHPQPAKDAPAQFLTVTVPDDGVVIAHPQLTLRDRSKPVEPTVQHVSLSCLVCNTLVYRVAQTIHPGEEAREGPVVPVAEWAEQDVLLSSTGLIDVSVACLTGDSLRRARESERFSDTFAILVTQHPSTPAARHATHNPLAQAGAHPQTQYALAPFPAPLLFAPPPFSPSHPAFAHLSKRAQARSEHLRHQAELDVQQIVSKRLADLDAADRALKTEVEAIWRSFRDGWRAAVERIPYEEQSLHPLHNVNNTLSFNPDAAAVTATQSKEPPTPTQQDPQPLIARRPSLNRTHSSQSHAPSLLSASLRQTGFHLPPRVAEAQGTQGQGNNSPSPPPYASHDDDSSDDPSRPPRYDGLTTSGSKSPPVDFRRNMDPNLDISTSVRIGSILAQQAREHEHHEQERAPKRKKKVRQPPTAQTSGTGSTSTAPSQGAAVPGPSASASAFSPPRGSSLRTSMVNGTSHSTPEKDRGKRKVTFDEEPEVLVIQPAPASPAVVPAPAARPPPEDDHVEEVAIFDLDGLDEAHPAPPPPTAPSNPSPSRAVNGRAARTSSLLASMSYRAPSALSASASAPPTPPAISASAPTEHFKPYEEHLRSLVAADYPTHREAWKKGGKAWAMFARGRRHRSSALVLGDTEPEMEDDSGDEEDEAEEKAQEPQIARSLPIAIAPVAGLGAARRRPQLDDVPEELVPENATARQRAAMILHRGVPDEGVTRSLV